MGLLQKACETFDNFSELAGVERPNQATLAPVGHIITSAQIEIILDANGTFQSARAVDKREPKIVIPATEESAGRTGNPCPHPLCDQLCYLADYIPEKHTLYLEQLSAWANSDFSHPMLFPILSYVSKGTILTDLENSQVLSLDEHRHPRNEKDLVRWVVNGIADGGPCWTNRPLMGAFADWYQSRNEEGGKQLCLVSGKVEPTAKQHPKGIIPINGNAKLISSNDSTNFTYRGRFSQDWQATTVSYTASQKAHNALRWLAANQGIRVALPGDTPEETERGQIVYGGRTFLCWNPKGREVPAITGPMRRRNGNAVKTYLPSEYRKELRETLAGWQTVLPETEDAVIVSFDAATTGRLAVTYYNELRASDLLERLARWDESCCWPNGNFGIQSPSLYRIVQYAFGTQREGEMSAPPDGVLRQHMQQLVACRLGESTFPADVKQNLVNKASRLALYDKKTREQLLFITCAAIRKYNLDTKKEEWDMALDPENTNRSYLFGRLLAVAEKVEQSTYAAGEERETNAMRMQAMFAQRPLSTWRALEEKLRPYYKRLQPGSRSFYQKITQEIVDRLDEEDPALNHKLDDIYLLGYYHQRGAFYAKKTTENTTTENEED